MILSSIQSLGKRQKRGLEKGGGEKKLVLSIMKTSQK